MTQDPEAENAKQFTWYENLLYVPILWVLDFLSPFCLGDTEPENENPWKENL